MAKFTPVRHSGTSNTPVIDGQMLVDKSTGIVSFDIDNSRVYPNNVYGITKHVSTNLWILSDGRYYIDLTDLAKDDTPSGFAVVGASFLTGSYNTVVMQHNGSVRLYSDDRIDGNILIFTLPGQGYYNNTELKGLVALYHMDDYPENLVDCAGNTTITPDTGWSSGTVSKYGCRSIIKSSVGYIQINGIQDLNAFTIEWWQYDTSSTGDGGIIIKDSQNKELEMVPISVTSDKYIHNDWKHIALVRKDSSIVYIYVNGDLVGFSNFNGSLNEPIKFYGTGTASGNTKLSYIDELAIFNYARYSDNFEPQVYPYVGAKEVSIAVHDNIVIDKEVTQYQIPVELSNGDIPVDYEIQGMAGLGSEISIDNGTLNVFDPSSAIPGTYKIIVNYPGSVSNVVNVIVKGDQSSTDPNVDHIYYGYFRSTSATSVVDITEDDLTSGTIQSTSEVGECILDFSSPAPAGSFIVCLVPDSSSLIVKKSDGCREYINFNGTLSCNGDTVVLNGKSYRAYGELCLIDAIIDMSVIDGYIDTSKLDYVELLADGDTYVLDDIQAEPEDRVYTQVVTPQVIVSGAGELSGTYTKITQDGETIWSN